MNGALAPFDAFKRRASESGRRGGLVPGPTRYPLTDQRGEEETSDSSAPPILLYGRPRRGIRMLVIRSLVTGVAVVVLCGAGVVTARAASAPVAAASVPVC